MHFLPQVTAIPEIRSSSTHPHFIPPQVPAMPEIAGDSNWVKVYTVTSSPWPKPGGFGGDYYVHAVMSICSPPLFAQV